MRSISRSYRDPDIVKHRAPIREALNSSIAEVSRNPRNALAIARSALQQANALGDPTMEARSHTVCAEAYRQLGKKGKVAESFEAVEDLLPRLDNSKEAAAAIHGLGYYRFHQGIKDEALRLLFQALDISRALSDNTAAAFVLHTMGIIYEATAVYDRAIESYLESLRLREETGPPLHVTMSLNSLGKLYLDIGAPERALSYYQRALDIIESNEGDFSATYGIILNNIGNVLVVLGRPKEALPYLNRNMELLNSANNKYRRAFALLNLGQAWGALQDVVQAMEYLENSVAASDVPGLERNRAQALIQLGTLLEQQGEQGRALDLYEEARTLSEERGFEADLSEIYGRLAGINAQNGNYHQAYLYQQKKAEADDRLLSLRSRHKIADVEQRYALLGVEREREELRRRAEIAEHEATARLNELQATTLNLTRRNAVLKDVQNLVSPYETSTRSPLRKLSRDVLNVIESVVDIRSDWETFEEQFNRVHADYIQRLCRRCPSLTPTELKVCVLIRMSLSTQEIADMLFTSKFTVKTHRTRIRKKLKLALSENLTMCLTAL